MAKFLRNFCSRILFVRNFRMHLSHITDMTYFFNLSEIFFEWNVQNVQQSVLWGGLVLHTAVHRSLESQYCDPLILENRLFS